MARSRKKSILYNLFNPSKDGKGVPKTLVDPRAPLTLGYFFKVAWRNISNLFTLNMYMVIGNFPVLIFMFGLSGNLNRHITAASAMQYGAFYGVFNNMDLSPVSGALLGVYGIPSSKQILTWGTYLMFALGALVLLTFGPVNTGATYVLRNLVKGEPMFMWQDFTKAIKTNWKQAIALGIIDLLAGAIFIFDLIFFYANTGALVNNIMFGLMVLIFLYYVMMRFYMYIMITTFDLKMFKVLKNSLIFSLVNLKRNIVAVLGIAAMLFFDYYLFLMFMPLGVIFPFVFMFSGCTLMGIYAAWPKIKEIMIDPYVDETVKPEPEEPIFHDMG